MYYMNTKAMRDIAQEVLLCELKSLRRKLADCLQQTSPSVAGQEYNDGVVLD